MSELRERFRALDALDVPDVMSRARTMGPIPPGPDRTPPMRRVGALVLAAVIAIAAVVLIIRTFNQPLQPADPTPTPTDTLRRDGEVITYSGDPFSSGGDLLAQDPTTGEVRVLVDGRDDVAGGIGSAAWSADGRWLAFEILGCSPDIPTAGLWVTNSQGEHRQLTMKRCIPDSERSPINEFWAWSPTAPRLVVERITIDGDPLVVIDPETGEQTDLGEAFGDVTALAWSPDGARIVYGTHPSGSIYMVGVDGGDHSVLASSLGYAYGFGESAIHWSPDGAHIVIQAWDITDTDPPDTVVYLMNSDGSGLRELETDGQVDGISWSPDGTQIAYASFSGGPLDRRLQIWTVTLDGSAPSLLFESSATRSYEGGRPVWSPDGTQIAFEHVPTDGEAAWPVVNADGTGPIREVDELRYLSWRGGWYFCECYG